MDTNFTDQLTVVDAAWLNDVNKVAYLKTFPDGTTAATSQSLAASGGANLAGFSASNSASGTVARALVDRGVCVTDAPFNADPTGAMPFDTALADAMAAAKEVIIPSGSYTHANTIVPVDGVTLRCESNVTITYTGTGKAWQSPTTGFVSNFHIRGEPTIDFGSATTAIELNSPYLCSIDVKFSGASTTAILLAVQGNSTGSTNPNGNHNAAFNFLRFRNLGTCGTELYLNGYSSTDGIVTDNWIDQGCAGSPAGFYVHGVNCVQWCDSNTWVTKPLFVPLGTTAVCVELNSATPTANAGVYGEVFQGGMAIDCFGTPAGDARIGVKQNFSTANKLGFVEANPVPAGGTVVNNGNVYATEWEQYVSATSNYMFKNFYGQFVGIGGGQNSSYSLYTSNYGPLQGSNQASAVFADTFNGSGANAGITISNQVAVAASSQYAAINITDVGTTSSGSVGTQIAINVPSLAAGTTANYGLKLGVPNTNPNNLNIYVSGNAPNFLAGPLSVNGATPPAQVTGWGTPTGASVVSNFPGASATLAQTSEAVAEIITALKNFGLFGA